MKITILLLSHLIMVLASVNVYAAAQSGRVVAVPHHQSTQLMISGSAKKVTLGDPSILDILVLRSNELYLIGKKLGTTNVSVWDRSGRIIESFNVEVTHDLNTLKSKLHQFLPDENIEVHSTQDKIVLRGLVSSQQNMDVAIKVAETFAAGKPADESDDDEEVNESSIINLLSIGGAQQVTLEVTVAEVQRSLVRTFDSNFHFFQQSGDITWGATTIGSAIDDIGPILSGNAGVNEFGFLGSFLDSNTLFTFALDIAKQNGVAKVLAEPSLTALSGTKAEFVAGGEFPIPVPNEDGITIDYKEYGVTLDFIPYILSDKKINLKLNVSVSELATSGVVTYSVGDTNAAYYIPPLTKRSAGSTLELADGQTIGIAGLLSENARNTEEGLPGVSDLPVLGRLFKSEQFTSGETELVILVTPRLAKPVDRRRFTLPTDGFVSPNDVEFYLLGKGASLDFDKYKLDDNSNASVQDQTEYQFTTGDGGTEGQFGHSL
ncbi:type II and III secretion system protein family protein [Vibrio natriegens]|uniref:Pilus assembly protein CpaC n=1 Tax=Vibrio natriegens NBRC 15636 = ATCC 14048 = DSM 759 TaxID=1219067 RepID=A0AAN0Y3V8_VIBNA|nr:type II and III secretion system protein family protein [Vibrio natriegens]ALR14772.1 pilus assembly protein CpaC [Vibrio natriegens NBRC 15636 = ATCC 14048 = DSM 759]ANQ13364.1 pilus assembly protein CpaC [Vibrio natriegens NBRC 15636 = ATCC 14048 = DSM 759]EPM40761.1 pilus assembly protein CpaC [Vibrio natriegens NBRC 15636 = ATCC 14048 = DSM 759]MDX6027799.1 type II and III secretion system protein family protein [Vibrio natriegens NBRC 15636 = ATCC 14048 = DSM 759]UUI11105.1 type II and